MTPAFAKAVDPVFLHVLGLLDRLSTEGGSTVVPEDERVRIKSLIDVAEGYLGQAADWQLAKYALVAWIDEVLIETDWPGRDWWNENVLEVEIFNTRLANEQFYVRAKEASGLQKRDALEVFYVCVVMGFRGLYRDAFVAQTLAEPRGLPPTLDGWFKHTQLAIRLGQGRPILSDAGDPGPGAPPLSGESLLVWSALIGVFLAAFVSMGAWILFFS